MEKKGPSVVLPDTLIMKLISEAAGIAEILNHEFKQISSKRQELRDAMMTDKALVEIPDRNNPIKNAFVVDGADVVELDRASGYSISCAVSLGPNEKLNDQMSCLALLPHTVSLDALSRGLMLMQEIMMAVSIVENNETAICFIDGSRISAIIAINSFYSGIMRDLSQQLNVWRMDAKGNRNREPGKTLDLFERRDWLTPFLTHPRIVGNLKLVTTHYLVEKYTPDWVGRFDDKTLAALILEPSEAFEPVSIPKPDEPYHTNKSFPWFRELDLIQSKLTTRGDPLELLQTYYRPKLSHGIFKIEFNQGLLQTSGLMEGIFDWWQDEVLVPDIQEPYSYYLADRFAKEAVSLAAKALKEIAKRDSEEHEWAWYLTQPNRTV